MSKMRFYRRVLMMMLCAATIYTVYYTINYINDNLPDSLKVLVNNTEEIDMKLPIGSNEEVDEYEVVLSEESNIPADNIKMSLNNKVVINADKIGKYDVEVKLFGIIPLKNVEVEVVEKKSLYVGGYQIGIYLQTDGVMIIGTGKITGADGLNYEPALSIVKSGDYIVSINGVPVSSKSQLTFLVNKYGSNDIVLGIRRNNEVIDVKIKPINTGNDEYKLGIWVRDDTQGIGTLTYIDESGNFGALGHGISDVDTGEMLSSSEGLLYKAEIWGVTKGESGKPGGLNGTIDYESKSLLGTITVNSKQGIFGKAGEALKNLQSMQLMEVGYKQEVEKGEAFIRTCIEGEEHDYKIEIESIDINSEELNKGMVIKVVDDELLEKTNGIVQGMSGSPIIQNGKIIGAVTHVFVKDCTRGYGIFIESMLTHTD